jgi:signal peptidase II
MPAAGGYATWFMGKVVDMFYFPLFTFPDWMPLLGGEIFFSPIFNLADSYITVAIFMLIIFYHKDFNDTIERYTKRQ